MQKQSKNIMVATWIWNGADERDGRIWILKLVQKQFGPAKKKQKYLKNLAH